MKCKINGKIVDAKVVENLGFVHGLGSYAKCVLVNGIEYHVFKSANGYRNMTFEEKFGRQSNYRGA